ncbi:helix-turn-helix transcriptional regulator [Maridesulfovibrio sp.]|uniref:helix-turn-helix domain-containing protein n=1 Tax=Maridesulfovibrio sp. TaxID=2795000 RepID=UPI0029CA4191|nr:helix-turn-helix transcriptional regulator [Maridesulfovibrio sp.]
MNIKEDLKKFLEDTGWTAAKLANEANISAPVITRFLSGARKGLHSSTLEKLWPYLYGDKRPKPETKHDQAA